MSTKTHDVVVIGAGIVGLAVALEISRRHPRLRLAVLDKEDQVARHQSGHNSGVIHSGIYYKPGSLKARLCVSGAEEMLRFCRDHGVPHQVCGKLILATSEDQFSALDELRRRAEANGLVGVRLLLDPSELREIEPHASGLRALHVPSTAVTDYGQVCLVYAELLQHRGVELRMPCAVTGLRRSASEVTIETSTGELTTRRVINCAGLFSDRISRLIGDDPGIQIVPFRGEYFELTEERAPWVRALIYPVPDPAFPFLGVHFTRRISGRVDAGPNAVLALRREGYHRGDVDLRDVASLLGFRGFWRMGLRHWRSGGAELRRSFSKSLFTRALQSLVPAITEDDLRPSASGVRAQAVRPDGTLVDDFMFVESDRALHVLNVPSPAATASLSIARVVVDKASHLVA
jgi:L-2-hydroxyglutarate oxidase LhgO